MSERRPVRNADGKCSAWRPRGRRLIRQLSVALVITAGLVVAAVIWPVFSRTPGTLAALALLTALLLATAVTLCLFREQLHRERRLTAARQAELQALTAQITGLVDALSAKEDAVSNVSHEFRTPLTSIIGNLDLVLADSGDLPPAAERRVEVAQRNAERLLALVSDLLVPADTALDVHLRRTDLAGLVEASLGSAQAHAEASGVTLAMDVPAPLWARADPLRISQALDNLVSNGIKYSPGGTVRVSAGHEDGRVLLHVTDDGMGMTADDAGQVFTRFFRSPAVREGAIPGVGLGLSITKAIVERHGGSISCRSQPGCGSTFTVELPAAAAPPSY